MPGSGKFERPLDLGDLGLHLVILYRMDARLEVVDLQHFDVGAKLGMVHGEVRVHVEHAGVGVAEKADAAVVQLAHNAGRLHPLLDLAPGAVVVLLGVTRGRVEQAGDDVELDAAAGKGVGDLGHAAGTACRQPFARVGIGIVERWHRLQVEDQHGRLAALHRRQHLG